MTSVTLPPSAVSARSPAFWPAWLPGPVALGAVLLTVYYAWFYLAFGEAPGNSLLAGGHSLGWMGWYDQGKTYDSALALASGNYDVGAHWYPLGYALLGAAFILRLHGNAFFFVDVICLLLAYWGFVAFARRVGISAFWGVPLFIAATADTWLFRQWVIPWSSTPSAALSWMLLATTAAHMRGKRRPFLLGLLAAPLPLFRPMDVLIGAPCILWAAWFDLISWRMRARDVLLVLLGAAVTLVPYGILYLRIYGFHQTPYTLMSRGLGFTIHHMTWRAYTLFIEPREWYLQGVGLLQRCPWLILGFAGILLGWRDRALALLSFCLVVYCGMYLCYIDLLPSGLWRFNNVHYFKWAMPGFALLGFLLLRELLLGRAVNRAARGRRVAAVALVVVLLLSCLRVSPREIPPGSAERATAIDIIGEHTNDENSYFGPLIIQDAGGTLTNIYEMRVLPTPDGLRIIALRRDMFGPIQWLPEHSPAGPLAPHDQRRYAIHRSVGWPCWLPPYACKPVNFEQRDDPLLHNSRPVSNSLNQLEGK